MIRCFLLISAFISYAVAYGQKNISLLPQGTGQAQQYDVTITMKHSTISGIAVVENNGDSLTGVVVNEFGITAMAWTYNPTDAKVRLLSVIAFLDKWYIKKVLRRDIRHLMLALSTGQDEYVNSKRGIHYTFRPQHII